MARQTRADRFAAVKVKIGEARTDIEELRDELQSWLDNLPENLQGGSKADQLEGVISELDDLMSSLEDAENTEIEFPGAV